MRSPTGTCSAACSSWPSWSSNRPPCGPSAAWRWRGPPPRRWPASCDSPSARSTRHDRASCEGCGNWPRACSTTCREVVSGRRRPARFLCRALNAAPEGCVLTTDALNHPDTPRLRQFAAGALGDDELDRIAEHLPGCEACRAAVDVALVGDGFLDRLRPATTLGADDPEGKAARRRAALALSREVRRSGSTVPDPAGEGPSLPGEVGHYVVLGEGGRGGDGGLLQARHPP